jgi:hypothetical protein
MPFCLPQILVVNGRNICLTREKSVNDQLLKQHLFKGKRFLSPPKQKGVQCKRYAEMLPTPTSDLAGYGPGPTVKSVALM